MANAADGCSLGHHSPAEVRAIGDDVVAAFNGLSEPDQTARGLLRVVDDCCRGKWLSDEERTPSRHLGKNPRSLASEGEGFSTVVHGGRIRGLVRQEDYDRICGALLVSSLMTTEVEPGSFAERKLMDRSAAARELRRVRLAPGKALGSGVVWMTRTRHVDALIDQADGSGASRATIVTDALGLLFPKLQPSPNAMNQRFALHFPATLVSRRQGFRPTSAEAGDYARFKARPVDPVTAKDWGRTMDLGRLANGGGLCDGLDEITLWPIAAADLADGEFIELEYLGTIKDERGERAVDDDKEVAKLLMAGRTVARALGGMR